jgi:hypothetical protein
MEQNDEEMIAMMRRAEDERRKRAMMPKEPRPPREPMSLKGVVILCTIAICGMIALVAYSYSDEAFWKPTGTQKVWCQLKGLSWWECREYDDVEK